MSRHMPPLLRSHQARYPASPCSPRYARNADLAGHAQQLGRLCAGRQPHPKALAIMRKAAYPARAREPWLVRYPYPAAVLPYGPA